MGNEIRIRPWDPVDEPVLIPMIEGFLAVQVARGGDMLPTRRNAVEMFKLGCRAAQREQPSLIAEVDGAIGGWCLWWYYDSGLDLRYRTCIAAGSYTLPAYRHAGIAAHLRKVGLSLCQRDGIERIMGPVHLMNRRALKVFIEEYGAWPVSVTMEVLL